MNNVASLSGQKGNARGTASAFAHVSRVHLVGRFRVTNARGENLLPRSVKTQAVLAYLCLAQGERVSRSVVAGLIWDRSTEAQARDRLRQALREVDQAGIGHIEAEREVVRLDLSTCWVDAFESPERSDPLLDGLEGASVSFDRWLIGERARFETDWQTRLERELNALIAANSAADVRAAAARRLLNFMPTHEAAARALMTAFADLGDYSMAIREYERFRVVVDNSLQTRPGPATSALYDEVRKRSRAHRTAAPNQISGTDAGMPKAERRERDGAFEADALPSSEAAIAVLPYRDLSRGPGHEHVVEGLTEDLVETLSRVPGLCVISRESAAVFRDQVRTPQEIGTALGVRYIISGSVRIISDRWRLIAQLVNAETGRVLWRSRFDELSSDLLDLQDELAKAVVRSVAPQLRAAELNRIRVKHPSDYSAYDLFLRAQENMHSPSREAFEAAERLFEQAIHREPQYSAALAWRAYWHVMRIGQGWSPDPAQDTEQADRFARLAAECDASEAMAYAVQGHAAAFLHKDFDLAFSCFETALRFNPNNARAWLWSAYAHAWFGDGAQAVDKINRAMALSPYDPLACAYSGGAGMAYLADRQYVRAIEFALRGIRENGAYSGAYRVLITALVLAGDEDNARAQVQRLLALEPGFTVQQFRRRYPGSARPAGELYADAFARAGVPLSD